MTESRNEWQYGEHSGLVSIGTHSLFLQASGPPRNPGEPAVITESGLGGPGFSWASVARLVSPFARIYIYSRSGLGKSQRRPTLSPRTATAMAAELSSLLNAAAIDPPFILVSHSYGGVIAREFLAQRTADVVGMVFVDTNTERTEIERPVDRPLFLTILGNLDIYTVLGMDTHHSFTPEEWMAIKSDDENDAAATDAEHQEMASSGLILGSKNQLDSTILGDYPVSVIRGDSAMDIRKILNAGVAAGNGTKEQHEKMKFFVDGLAEIDERHQREQLKLSKCGRMVYARESGHNVQITEPEVVAEEIRWIWDTLNAQGLRVER
ncbi:hypothetical protein MMC14_008318 [Varicellaria rhodocarpa]|nr:hypothetical protein [Varicellaria rhodocarpa]